MIETLIFEYIYKNKNYKKKFIKLYNEISHKRWKINENVYLNYCNLKNYYINKNNSGDYDFYCVLDSYEKYIDNAYNFIIDCKLHNILYVSNIITIDNLKELLYDNGARNIEKKNMINKYEILKNIDFDCVIDKNVENNENICFGLLSVNINDYFDEKLIYNYYTLKIVNNYNKNNGYVKNYNYENDNLLEDDLEKIMAEEMNIDLVISKNISTELKKIEQKIIHYKNKYNEEKISFVTTNILNYCETKILYYDLIIEKMRIVT